MNHLPNGTIAVGAPGSEMRRLAEIEDAAKAPKQAITNLAGLKRAIRIGAVIRVVNHWQEQLVGSTRTPTRVQTNGYYFQGMNLRGDYVEMWAETPKASQLRFNADGTVTYFPDTERSWTLAFNKQ